MQPWAWREMKAAVKDPRTGRSLATLCENLADQPGIAFSNAVGSAGRQAASRAFRAPALQPAALLQGHVQQTAQRAAGEPWVLVAQDTTVLSFVRTLPNRKSGLKQQRVVRELLAHSALALSEAGVPLGVLHLDLWERAKGPAAAATAPTPDHKQREIAAKESRKWLTGLAATQKALAHQPQVLLLQDREGDVFELFAAPRRPGLHLLVRAAQPRKVAVPPPAPGEPPTAGTLFACAATAPSCGTLCVPVPVKPLGKPSAEGPVEREAVLTLRLAPLEVQPPARPKGSAPLVAQRLWILQAAEEEPPAGETAICWVLLTTVPPEPGQEARHAAWLVRCYALRWRIERLHFVLKEGLKVEQHQHEDAAIKKVVALCYVVAWKLLQCLYLSRTAPATPASTAFGPSEVAVLQGQSGQPVRTVAEGVMALARLAGYQPYPRAKPPGVKRLWEGHRRLQDLVKGYELARQLQHL